MRLVACLLAFTTASALHHGQDTVLSLVAGLKPGDRVHMGVSTTDSRMDRCRILFSVGSSTPFSLPRFPGVEIVIAPGRSATLATLLPQPCLPPASSQVGFGYGGVIPAAVPAGTEVHLQALVSSSTDASLQALSNGIVVTTNAAGPALTRWGARALTTALRIQQFDVDTLSVGAPLDISLPMGPTAPLTGVALRIQPAVSDNDLRAAIPMALTDTRVTFGTRTAVFVLQNIRTPGTTTPTGDWLPLVDPALANFSFSIAGSPRFRGNNEVWVIENQPGAGTTTEYYLARYDISSSPATFLGACHLHDTSFPDAYLATEEWLIDSAGKAVFLQQNRQINGQGLELVRYDPVSGGVTSRASVDPNGFAVFHASFIGIAQVPSKPWGFVQYGTGLNGASHARLIDLLTGDMTASLPVGIRPGRFSSDGNLVLFEGTSSFPRDMVPVRTLTLVAGQPLDQLAPVDDYFCGGDSLATDGTTIVGGPYNCSGGMVRRARLDEFDQIEVASVCMSTGVGPAFDFYTGSGPRSISFRVPGRNAVFNLTGASQNALQMLDATTMTYGTSTQTLSARFFF